VEWRVWLVQLTFVEEETLQGRTQLHLVNAALHHQAETLLLYNCSLLPFVPHLTKVTLCVGMAQDSYGKLILSFSEMTVEAEESRKGALVARVPDGRDETDSTFEVEVETNADKASVQLVIVPLNRQFQLVVEDSGGREVLSKIEQRVQPRVVNFLVTIRNHGTEFSAHHLSPRNFHFLTEARAHLLDNLVKAVSVLIFQLPVHLQR
jgi:hypothetical protein